MTTLLAKLRAAASTDATLGPLLGPSPFRWYDQQLTQGTAFPAVSVQVVSNQPTYSNTALLSTALYRVQFKCFSLDPQVARQVASAIKTFLLTFNAYNAGDSSPIQRNRVVMERDFGIAQTAPFTAIQIVDAMIYNNELL